MKLKLLILFTLLSFIHGNTQNLMPCPPGFNPIYSIDLDNDGFTSFDINYYIQSNKRPNLENQYNFNSSGYTIDFYNSNNDLSLSPYTNIILNESGYFRIEYSGTGSLLNNNSTSCYIDPYLSFEEVALVAVPFDGDDDNDGISNKIEDTNNNLNLMDDDEDSDGIINLLDPVTLSNTSFSNLEISIYPNPATNGFLNITANLTISEITLYDFTGKVVLSKKINATKINLESISKGAYFIKISTEEKSQFKKIIVN